MDRSTLFDSFRIDGLTVVVSTDENGYASFDITVSLCRGGKAEATDKECY